MKGSFFPRQRSTWACVFGVLALVAASSAPALEVDLDPAPQIPLPAGQSQFFLVNLSKPAAFCAGKVSFTDLPEGLSAEPKEQTFKLDPGGSAQLAFKITCTAWGELVTIRPKITVEFSGRSSTPELINFPEQLETKIIRDQKLLDKQPLDKDGLLFYYSFGDGWEGHSNSNIFADKYVGERSMWNEGLWNADGGVKGKGTWGASGDAEVKVAFAPLNHVDHRRGTILFWLRKSTRVNEITYAAGAKMDYDSTWQIGPTICDGHRGEGIFGANWTPQDVAARRVKDWKKKPASDSFISLRRYKAQGDKRGYLEATYLAMRQRRYTVRAWFDWMRDWRHVAVLWDTDNRRLAIYIDGQLASDKLRTNGKDETDPVWYPAPWNLGVLGENAQFGIIQYTAEGGVNETDRDEFYVYNRPMKVEDIQVNMKAAMGKVVVPLIGAPAGRAAPTSQPAARGFHDSLAVEVVGLWSNPTHHYTLDGSDPDEKSPAYDKPIVLTKSTTLKVRSFLKGFEPSDVVVAKFESLGSDKSKPAIQDILAVNDPNTVLVVFDKKVDRDTAEDAANYTLDGGVKVDQAGLDDDRQTVRLKVAPALASGKEYKLTVKAVKDVSESANVMDDAVNKPFQLRHLPGLAAWWSFDVVDGGIVKDFGPNRIDGTAYRQLFFRGATLVDGHKGKAIYLKDAGDFVDISKHAGKVDSINLDDMPVDHQSPFHTDSGSVFLWLKAKPGYLVTATQPAPAAPTTPGTAPATQKAPAPKPKGVLMHSRDILSKGYAHNLFIGGGSFLYVGTTATRPIKVCPIADDTWHHVGLVFQNNAENGSKVYVDGELKASVTLKFLRHVGTRLELCQPRNWGGSDAFLDGAIDEVMFFTRLLTADEARQLYRDGFLSAEPAKARE